MLFQLFWIVILFPIYSSAIETGLFDPPSRTTDNIASDFHISEVYRQVKEMTDSNLFSDFSLPGYNYSMIQISPQITFSMRERCFNSYDRISKNSQSYNGILKKYIEIGQGNSIDEGDLEKMKKAIKEIKAGVSGCVEQIRGEYVSLSNAFVSPLLRVYSFSVDQDRNLTYLNQGFVNDIRNHFPNDNSKAGQIRRSILDYKNFESSCITGVGVSISSLEKYFRSTRNNPDSVKGQFNNLARFFKKEEEYCLAKLKELEEFTKSGVFQEFIGLPGRCAYRRDAKIESLKKAVLLSRDSDEVSEPDVLNYCEEEYAKTGHVCYCAEEDCSNDRGDSVLEKIYRNDESVCGKSLNSYLNTCRRRANQCSEGCNKRLGNFKKEYKDLFFVKDLNPNPAFHIKYKTKCQGHIREIHDNFEASLAKSPYNNESARLRGRRLSSLTSFKSFCELPVKSLIASYESLEKTCEDGDRKEAKKEEDKNQTAQANQAQSYSVGNTGWGTSSRSQEDEIRERYGNTNRNYNPNSPNRDNQEFNYSQSTKFNAGSGLTGSSYYQGAKSDNLGNSKKSKSGDPNNRNSLTSEYSNQEDYDASKREGADGYEGAGKGSDLSSGGNLAGGVLSGPSRAWDATKKKAKEIGLEVDKRVRDYLLKDTDMLKYRNGYLRTEKERMEERTPSTGIRGLPRRLREKAYEAYSNRFPISREEYRKRMGLMRENVDLAEVQDLMFYRFCYTRFGKEECDEPNDPKAKDRTLESVITRYNELAESQLITPEEKFAISQERLRRQRSSLTREQDLNRMINSLEESERKAKITREQMGLSF